MRRSKQAPAHAAGAYDYATIHGIVNTAPILHVAFQPTDPADNPFPTILPMIGAMASYANPTAAPGAGPLDLYLHGSATARMVQMADRAGGEGVPVCVAATHVDGYVLALAPFHNSYNYRSTVLHGHLTAVADAAERTWALERITDLVVPGRWAASREPPTAAEERQTGVLKVRVVSASAKVRAEGVGKEDRKDERDPEVRGKVWTGVVPAWTHFGEGVPSELNVVQEVPAYLEGWRTRGNEEREGYAVNAAGA